jgi:hypothetical protein
VHIFVLVFHHARVYPCLATNDLYLGQTKCHVWVWKNSRKNMC